MDWKQYLKKHKLVGASDNEVFEHLRAKEYHQTSRKFCIISRVDISVEKMLKFFIKDNFGDKRSGVPSLPVGSQEEQYRRVYSQDKIENVPEPIMNRLREGHMTFGTRVGRRHV